MQGPPASRPILGIARPGWPIILGLFLFSSILAATGVALGGRPGVAPGVLLFIVTLWALWFFRDPRRTPPAEPGAIVSAADGVVRSVGPASPPAELGLDPAESAGMTRVSVFMNIFNVHVNRAPASLTLSRTHYRPGRFFNASLDKASEHNERLSYLFRTPDGRPLVVVQIAGLIARRIVRWAGEGDSLPRAARIGMIRFGSRVDVYLPRGVDPAVQVGAHVLAGTSIIATDRAPVTDRPRAGSPGVTAEA